MVSRLEMIIGMAVAGGLLVGIFWAPLHFILGVPSIPYLDYYLPHPLDVIAVGIALGALAGLALSSAPDEPESVAHGNMASEVGEKEFAVLFDIDGLGSAAYGAAAYRIIFDALASVDLEDCRFSDGDTNATLFGNAREYCIAMRFAEAKKMASAWSAINECSAKGLLPAGRRFLAPNEIHSEPLVPAGRIDERGELVDCTTGWMIEAWEESRKGRG